MATSSNAKEGAGYVRSLMANRSNLKAAEHDEEKSPLPQKDAEAVLSTVETAGEEEKDGAGRVSDWRVYVYYARALGWFGLSVFLAFTSVNAGVGALQRELT